MYPDMQLLRASCATHTASLVPWRITRCLHSEMLVVHLCPGLTRARLPTLAAGNTHLAGPPVPDGAKGSCPQVGQVRQFGTKQPFTHLFGSQAFLCNQN
eukprot:4376650-Amphidinium_carterae.1